MEKKAHVDNFWRLSDDEDDDAQLRRRGQAGQKKMAARKRTCTWGAMDGAYTTPSLAAIDYTSPWGLRNLIVANIEPTFSMQKRQ